MYRSIVVAGACWLTVLWIHHASAQPENYRSVLARIQTDRQRYARAYTSADAAQRDSLIGAARELVLRSLVSEIFPAWYGTPWEFHGTTQTPGSGTIACGYFVTTTLRDVGFRLPRIRWAQLAAEAVVKKACPPRTIWRRSLAPIDSVTAHIERSGPGLYLVGLDCHVGFIVHYRDTLSFVHSSYYRPEIGVMSEPLDSENPLRDSRYRVIGRLLSDEMMRRWITGEAL